MNTIIFKHPRTLTPQDRLAWFRMASVFAGLFTPSAYRWKWCK